MASWAARAGRNPKKGTVLARFAIHTRCDRRRSRLHGVRPNTTRPASARVRRPCHARECSRKAETACRGPTREGWRREGR
eukprot:3359872-Rhodomonas_salina.1